MNDVLFSDVSKTYTEYKTWGTVTCHFTNSGNDTYTIFKAQINTVIAPL